MSGRLVATDSTRVKASASRASEYLAEAEGTAGAYWERLDGYEEEASEELALHLPGQVNCPRHQGFGPL